MLVTVTTVMFCGADGGSVRGEGREGWEGGGGGTKEVREMRLSDGSKKRILSTKHFKACMHVLMTYDLC